VFVTILRWTIGVIAVLLAVSALFGLVISVAFENEIWGRRSRRLRAWLGVVALAWFNGEVWGRVVHTLVHWAG
jgi:ABC-type sugar transport system permease subunit